MLKMNKDYKELSSLADHIHESVRLEERIRELESEKAALEKIHYDLNDERFPYAEVTAQLERDALKTRPLKVILATIYATLMSAVIFVALYAIAYVLTDIISVVPVRFHTITLYVALGIAFVLTIIMIFTVSKRIWGIQTQFYRRKLIRKRQRNLEAAKEQTLMMIDTAETELKNKIRVVQKSITEDETNLKGHQTKIELSAIIPSKFIKDADKILNYFEEYRAETIKEAINLLVKERREVYNLRNIVYGIRREDVPVEALFEETFDPRSYEEKEAASQKQEESLETPLDAPLDDTLSSDDLLMPQQDNPEDEMMPHGEAMLAGAQTPEAKAQLTTTEETGKKSKKEKLVKEEKKEKPEKEKKPKEKKEKVLKEKKPKEKKEKAPKEKKQKEKKAKKATKSDEEKPLDDDII